jgi:hypothetical protein
MRYRVVVEVEVEASQMGYAESSLASKLGFNPDGSPMVGNMFDYAVRAFRIRKIEEKE